MDPGALDQTAAPSSRPWRFAPDDLLAGRYRVTRAIARGGMGEVYEVEDTQLHETVALKTLDARLAGDELARARFVGEVKAARRVAHPHVCRLFDFGLHQADGTTTPFLTMELLRGETLEARLYRGRPSWPEAQALLAQVAAAVDEAHRVGVVHRDLKPSNVMLVPGPGGEVRAVVTDFGIARRLAEPAVTAEGEWVGTPAYVAPEQLEGKEVTTGADVYAFGVMMFEVATGRLPFEGTSAFQVAMQRLSKPAPLAHEVAADVPAAWSEAIARCLARAPEKRWAHLSDAMAATLSAAPRPKSKRWPLAISLLAILGVGGWLAVRAAAAGQRLTVAGVPPSDCAHAEAKTHFAAAMGAHAAGRDDLMITHLEQAMQLAPQCGSPPLQRAYVALVYTTDPYPRAREAFRTALGLRTTLNARDTEFLDALLPAFSDPSDWKSAAGRLGKLATERPGDAQVQEALGIASYKAGERATASAAFARERTLDPTASLGWVLGAQLAATDPERVDLLRACVQAIPSGVDCRRELAQYRQNHGECAEVERLGRELTSLAPDVPDGYQFRAKAAAAMDEPTQSIATLLEKARTHLAGSEWTDAERATQAAWDGFSLQLRDGRFDEALASLDDLERQLATLDDDDQERNVTQQRVAILFESGEPARADEVARRYLESAATRPVPSWPAQDPTPLLLAYRRAAGGLSTAEHRAAALAWAESWRARLSPEGWAATWGPAVWAQTFQSVDPLVSETEAREAMAQLPSYGGLPPASRRPKQVGALLLAAGRIDEALARLEDGAKKCTLEPDVELLFLLGAARARKGDAAGACAAWRAVEHRWGQAHPRSLTAERARVQAQQAGCR